MLLGNKNNLIYALACPFTGEVHYVGKSTHGLLRPMSHLTESHSKEIREWVRDIGVIGYKPRIVILENNIPIDALSAREKYYIALYDSAGASLLNIAEMNYATIKRVKNDGVGLFYENNDKSVISQVSSVVRRARNQMKYTQEEMSYKTGFGLRWLRKLESGKTNSVMLDSLERLLWMIGYELKIERTKR